MPDRDFIQAFRGAHALLSLFWNAGFYELFEILFPEADDSYRREHLERWHTSYGSFWGALDGGNQKRLMEIAMDRYGDSSLPLELFTMKDCTV